jgi:hypothetical protein
VSAVTIPLSQRKGKFADAARDVQRRMQQQGLWLICEQRLREIQWSLSDGSAVPPNIASLLLTDGHIVGQRDSLFPDLGLSQTYTWRP